jgi:hypothetical protein
MPFNNVITQILSEEYAVIIHVRLVPCHHGMAPPQVADVRWVPCHHGMARPQDSVLAKV